MQNSLLLPFSKLQQLPDDDENVYCKNIIDRYSARPNSLEDMCLADFAANYTYGRTPTKEDEENNNDESDKELPNDDMQVAVPDRIALRNCLGCMRRRKRKAIVRWHNFNIQKEPEKHFRSYIMLFLPWRLEDQLKRNYISYADMYNDEIDRIKLVLDRFVHHEEDVDDAFQQLQTQGPPQAAWDSLAPGAEETQGLAQEEGISDEHPMAEEDIQAHIDQIVKEKPQSKNDSLNLKYTKEARKELLSSTQYNQCM